MPVNILSVENLSKSFNEKTLFKNLTVGIEQGQKVALVGVNGCGKSTLMKIIAGREKPDKGEVAYQKDLNIAYLPQSPQLNENETIADAIFSASQPEAQALREYHRLLEKENLSDKEQKSLQDALEQIDALNAWEYEYKAKEILGKLGIVHLEQQVGNLSGGQKKRIALAAVLVNKPDFLMLDEPTNHLDLDVIEWLEDYLSTANLSLLMVTHDRYFLDKVTNEIFEIDNGEIHKYKGNYSNYLEKKAEREEIAQKTKDKAQNLLRKELEWMRRQPKARGTKAKYRVDAFYELQDKATVNLSKSELELRTGEARQGKKILEMKKLTKSYSDKTIFENFNYTFSKGEKIGIAGKNGTGKTTFLNVLTQKLQPDSGVIEKGANTQIGYYTQSDMHFDEGKRVLDVVRDVAEVITLADGSTVNASQFLQLFLFPPATQYNPVSKLSGGEKKRLQLLRVLIANPNFLILDEPTNDLDLVTLSVLEDYLENFGGCLLLVSHDRYFMDRLVDHLFVFDETPEIKIFTGNYTDYRTSAARDEKPEPIKKEEPEKKFTKPQAAEKKKLSFKEQREFEQLEKEIPKLEQKKAELVKKLNSGSNNHEELQAWAQEIEAITEELNKKEMRWLELSDV